MSPRTFGDFWREYKASQVTLRDDPRDCHVTDPIPIAPAQRPQATAEPSCRCGATSFTTKPGPFGPHAAKQVCAGCGRFVRWLARAHSG